MTKDRPIQVFSPVLVGRDVELTSLIELALNPPSVALVEGEAGVGKSRLVDTLASHPDLRGVRILVGRCPALREPFVLGPLVEALRSLCDLTPVLSLSPVTAALRPLLPELGHILPITEAGTAAASVERHLLFRGVRELLDAAGPTVLIVEDLHWSDEATTEFLGFLIEDPPACLSVVLTCRSEDLLHSPLVQRLGSRSSRVERARLCLEPLAPAGVHTMVRAIVGSDVAEEVSLRIHERSGGLPFAVEEVVRLGRDRGLFDPDSAPPATALDLGVPPAVRDSVLERVAALAPDARAVVRAAGVLGVPASERSLAQICGHDPGRLATALCQALQAAILVELGPGRYGFRHPLATQSVYEAVPGPERKELHLKAANELARHRPPPLARLAYHCREAGRTRRWLDYAESAAHAAAERGDAAAGVRLLGDALRAPQTTQARRARLATKLGRMALSSGVGGKQEAVSLLRAAVTDELPGDTGVDLRILLAKLLTWSGDATAGYDELARCLPDLDRRPALSAHVLANLAAAPHLSVTVGERMRSLERAEALATSDDLVTLEVQGVRASVLVQLGDPDGWAAVEELPTHQGRPQERPTLVVIWSRLAMACAYVGHYRRARSFLEQADRCGDAYPRLVAVRRSLDLVLRWSVGDWTGLDDEARAHAFANLDMPSAWVPTRQIVGSLALARGDLDAAEQTLAECADQAGRAGFVRSLASSAAGLARIALLRGDPERARQVATRALEAVTASGVWVWAAELVPTVVEASIACGSGREARRLVREFASALRGRDAPVARASLRSCRALLAQADGNHERAAMAFAAATRGWDALPRPYEAARAAAQRGRCLLAGGGAGGLEALLDAQARLAHLGAAGDAQETGLILAGFGNGLRDAASCRGGKLSPRQCQVVELAARGMTSTEMAGILHISVRTVEEHVAAAVKKLGLSSKRSLISARVTAGRTETAEQNP